MTPQRLAPNLVRHFYRGGPKIAQLRGLTLDSDHLPEEWVGATVSRFGEPDVGPARTEAGDLVRDLVSGDPVGWLGSDVARRRRAGEADTGILVKLLDAGARLPVHVHPDRSFSARHLDCPYGKTEAWYVLDAEPDAAVHLGWREDVAADELARRRDAQDSEWMLERMHRLPVRAGDGILVPAGLVHAIGEGVFLVEVQEPTDLSIVLEWSVTTSTREESHLGVGFDTAMAAVSHTALSPGTVRSLRRHLPGDHTGPLPATCLPEQAEPFFRLDVAAPGTDKDDAACVVEPGFAVLVVTEGEGHLVSGSERLVVSRGETYVVPAGFGTWELRGPVRALVARPSEAWPADLFAEVDG
jgi:mannose-6-phosphate isomerase